MFVSQLIRIIEWKNDCYGSNGNLCHMAVDTGIGCLYHMTIDTGIGCLCRHL